MDGCTALCAASPCPVRCRHWQAPRPAASTSVRNRGSRRQHSRSEEPRSRPFADLEGEGFGGRGAPAPRSEPPIVQEACPGFSTSRATSHLDRPRSDHSLSDMFASWVRSRSRCRLPRHLANIAATPRSASSATCWFAATKRAQSLCAWCHAPLECMSRSLDANVQAHASNEVCSSKREVFTPSELKFRFPGASEKNM